jgi:hypothetical protein
MRWYPIGPDFVFTPRNPSFKRLSIRNELGRQGLVDFIAVDQANPSTIYVIDRPSSGGTAAFRTDNGGKSWECISDVLHQYNALVDPQCIAINPSHRDTIYLATYWDQGIYVSNDKGKTWDPKRPIPGHVLKLIVDPRTASNLATTALLAATTNGVYHSNDAGLTWTKVVDGDVFSMVAYMPALGTAHFYAGVKSKGVYYTNDPAGIWINLNDQGIGLPQFIAGDGVHQSDNFHHILVDICRKNPNRVYVWLAKPKGPSNDGPYVTEGIYTSSAPKTAWSKIASINPPNPAQGWYNYVFAVAPNSPGDGSHDIIFFGRIELYRSVDGGKNWVKEGTGFHADQHAFDFYPADPSAGTIPMVYVGCDGGIGRSSPYCDPAFDFGTAATYFNEGEQYYGIGIYENLNHSKQCSALYQYASHPTLSALNYIGCQDTGVNGGVKTLGWQGLADADAGPIAVAPGTDGLKVWGNWGSFDDFPSFRITLWTDKGDFRPAASYVTLGSSSGPLVNGTSNFELTPDDQCLAGAYVRDPRTTLTADITQGANPQAATPGSLASIKVGSILTVDEGKHQEDITVTAVTTATFTAVFAKDHSSGAKLWVNRTFAVRISKSGIATQISQDFGLNADPYKPKINVITPHFTDPNYIVCATNDQRVWFTTTGSAATSATLWSEAAGHKPNDIKINAIAITPNKSTYILLRYPVNTPGPGGAIINTPLFKLVEGDWAPQVCKDNPATTWERSYGSLVAHPTRDDTLFASYVGRVYRLVQAGGQWNWTDISDGLPGEWVYDLWVGLSSQAKLEEHVVLRAGIPTRGIWEHALSFQYDVEVPYLYLRDHLLDQGLLSQSEEGVLNPYDPARQVRHFECADIKVDALQPSSGSEPAFYQTDPEGGSPPFSHVLFDQLQDHSQSLQSNNVAWVHAQVHNRSYQPLNNVNVWAIYCNASAGVPSLSKSPSFGNNFPFWDQFKATGDIIPTLAADSPWKSVGPPVTLNNLDVYRPQVASWNWQIPNLSTGDPGHYCIVVFVHSAGCPINESSYDVDYITPRNRQIGQKNLHIGPPLSSSGGSGSVGKGEAPQPKNRGSVWPRMNEYVEFHNPLKEPRTVDLLFDFTHLPRELVVTLQLTPLDTIGPLKNALTGIRRSRNPRQDEIIRPGRARKLSSTILMPKFMDEVFEAMPSARVLVRNVRLKGLGFIAAFIRIRNTGTLKQGSRFTFEVQQCAENVVLGGSAYTIVIEGEPKRPPLLEFPFVKERRDPAEWDRIEKEAQIQKYIPLWATDIARRREREKEK